jgi:flagellar biosynthesis activator protein FlaF
VSTLNFTRTAYARPQAPARNPRSVEYEALARITQRLIQGWGGRKADFPALAAAIADNTRLWSTLAADVALPENGLPPRLRAQLFYLYQFSQEHGSKVLSGAGSVEVLVDINTAVMRGLRGETGDGA